MLLSEILRNPIYQRRTNAELANSQSFKNIPQTEWKGQTMKEKLAAVYPTRSAYTIANEQLEMPDNSVGVLGAKGNWLSGLTGLAKGYLGFKGAKQDAEAQQAYYQQLAELAQQDRADKQAQQAFENDFKDRELAQKEALQQGQFANQKELKQMEIDALNARAKEARGQALSDKQAQYEHEAELYKRGLIEQGIDPDLYLKDPEYNAQINAAKKQQALQDQLNAANIKLGESGKVGMDKVQQVIADPSRKLQYGDNSLISNFLGINKFGISKPQEGYQAPLTLSEITQNYKNPQQVLNNQQSIDPNKKGKATLNDIWGK